MGATAFHTAAEPGRDAGSRSAIAADTDDSRSPLATPWSSLARTRSPVASAFQKTTTLTARSSSPALATGRRPMWSESDPAVTSVARSATAYTAKTMVVTTASKPIRWARTG